jgi:hypothetical protein
MSDVLKHRFISPKLDGADTQQVQPSHWNDGHKFQGGNAGEVLTRDPTDLSFGAKWLPIVIPPAIQEVPGGGINDDVLTRDLTVPTFGSKWAKPASALAVIIDASITGTVNNWAPAGLAGKDCVILWNGASDLNLTGIAGGMPGQMITFKNRGAGGIPNILFPFNSGSSVEGNRFINIVSSASTPVAMNGSITFVYMTPASLTPGWYMVAHEQGAWIPALYNAADYYGGGSMTWTVTAGNVQAFLYRLDGSQLQIQWSLNSTTVGGTVTADLYRVLPGGFTARATVSGTMPFANSTTGVGELIIVAATTSMLFRRAVFSGSSNWVLGGADMRGSISVVVN